MFSWWTTQMTQCARNKSLSANISCVLSLIGQNVCNFPFRPCHCDTWTDGSFHTIYYDFLPYGIYGLGSPPKDLPPQSKVLHVIIHESIIVVSYPYENRPIFPSLEGGSSSQCGAPDLSQVARGGGFISSGLGMEYLSGTTSSSNSSQKGQKQRKAICSWGSSLALMVGKDMPLA